MSSLLCGAALEAGDRLDKWFLRDGQPEPEELVDHLVHLLADESSMAVRQVLGSVRPALPTLLCSTATAATVALLQALPSLATKYWLVRLDLCECRPPMYLLPSWAGSVMEATTLLADEDARVPTAAVTALVTLAADLPLDTAASGLPGYHSELLARAVFAAAPARPEEDQLPSALLRLLVRVMALLSTSTSRQSRHCLSFTEDPSVCRRNAKSFCIPSAFGHF